MNVIQLRELNQIHIESAEQAIKSSKEVVRIVHTIFPLYYLKPLIEASEIDVTLSKKIKDSYQKETNAINEIEKGNTEDGFAIFKKEAMRRKDLFSKKNTAAHVLQQIEELHMIHSDMDRLGKKRKKSVRKGLFKNRLTK